MLTLLRLIAFVMFVAAIVWVGRTVKVGRYTLFGHVERIWKTEEAQELVHDAKEAAGPAVERLKRGVAAGLREAAKEDDGGLRQDLLDEALDAGLGDAGLADAGTVDAGRPDARIRGGKRKRE